jgi:hypothetical protein
MFMAEDIGAPTQRTIRLAYMVDVLTGALQVAMESAILPDRFEIDEAEPRSRLEALTEQLLHNAKGRPSQGISEPEEAAGMVATIATIGEIAHRIHGEIR